MYINMLCEQIFIKEIIINVIEWYIDMFSGTFHFSIYLKIFITIIVHISLSWRFWPKHCQLVGVGT